MGRKSLKEDQQKRIIEAFYQVARQEGIENTSFGKVAKALDMNPSLVVHYFANKEEMTLGLVNFIIDAYENIYVVPEGSGNARDRLMAVLDNIFSRKWDSYVDDSVFYNCFALMFRYELVRKRFYDLHALLRQWLEKLIRECAEAGFISCPDPEYVADLIFVISDGAYYYLSMISDEAVAAKHLARYKAQAVSLLGLESTESSSRVEQRKIMTE